MHFSLVLITKLLTHSNTYESSHPTSCTPRICHKQKAHRSTDTLTHAAFCALCALLHLFAPFVCSVAPSVRNCSALIPMWLTCRSVSTSHLTNAYLWHHWILLYRTCVHMNSAGARGTFAAHPYGPNGAITSGTSRMDIISDPCDFLPSAAMWNPQKVCNIIKICMFLLFYQTDLLSSTLCLTPFFYISPFVWIL